MNKYERALERLEDRIPKHNDYTKRDYRIGIDEEYDEAISLLEQLIDKEESKSPWDDNVLACPNCGSGEYLYNEDGNENEYCGQCGQKIDWSNEEDESY